MGSPNFWDFPMLNTATLEAEHLASVRAMTPALAECAARIGVDRFMIAVHLMVGVARVRPDPQNRDLYLPAAPDEVGEQAYITPVRTLQAWAPYAVDPWDTLRFGELVDLVAWFPQPKRRRQWLTRAGSAWLGATLPREIEPFPTVILPAPLDWLRAAGEGVVILTSNCHEVAQLIGALQYVAIDDPETAARLQGLLEEDDRRRRPHILRQSLAARGARQ
jgi:hypothetical protein